MRVRYSFGSRHTGNLTNIRKQREQFPNIAEKVVRMADIILEVLDARFIQDTRNFAIESRIRCSKKEVIFVVNKIDLVNTNELVFSEDLNPRILLSTRKRMGGGKLRTLIKIEAKKFFKREPRRKNVYIGILGYPNVGKSSIINLLIGRRSAGVAAQPGFTKGIQKLKLGKGVLLIDTPGVIPRKEYSPVESELVEKNAIVGARSYADVKNPEFAISSLMQKHEKEILAFYHMTLKEGENFLEVFGKKKGLLLKGGIVDEDRAARQVLKDWQIGNIRVKQN
jgi:ribosome biogenesis GTPase A